MNYKLKNDKYVFTKDGVNFSLSVAQVSEMRGMLEGIENELNPKAMACMVNCTIDGDSETLPTCTWDEGNPDDCAQSSRGIKKEDCEYWKAI